MQPSSLAFYPLHCSHEPTLGDYYQDFSGAVELIETGYHGGLDGDGVPLVRYGDQGMFQNAVITAQYALANISLVLRGEHARTDRVWAQLNWLLAAQERTGAFAGCWLMQYDNPKYPWLRAPWISALASGQAISALLRGWELLGDERFRTAAEAAYAGLHASRSNMSLLSESDGELWYEEYPADQPLHVLNGHVYALLGVLDYARVTGDAEAAARWRRAAATLTPHLDEFDLGYWSAYDLRWHEPVSLHYHKNVHVPQLRILAALTGDARFAAVADRWERYVESAVSRVRWQVALRTHRWRKETEGRRGKRVGGAAPHATPEVRAPSSTAAGDSSSVSLRPFPYPFRAALAVCNDADQLTADSFRRLHGFLSTEADTEWGPGLALPLGGSFFMFRSPDSPNEFTVFDRLSSVITDDGEFILECAQRGILDVLHTYGCFTDPTHFTRGLAETAIETLRARGIRIKTWVNHGPPTNVQCMGTHECWQGDTVGTPGYHADLTVGYGVRWVWTGTEMTDRTALDASRSISRVDRVGRVKRRIRGADDLHKHLVEPHTLRDDQRVRSFYRYSGLSGRTPVLDDLPGQLSAANLDELVRVGGYAIVYQHLAVRRLRPGFGVGAYRPVDKNWFSPAELEAFRRLARRYRDGEIWVAPTTHLLRYRDAHEGLRWSARQTPEGDAICIEPELSGADNRRLSPDDLAGLTFYCDQPETTRVDLQGADTLEVVRCVRPNPADATGRRSITIRSGDE